jgi:hypothetical protein
MNAFKTLRDKIYIRELPSYGNKIFYSLGFLTLTSLIFLIGSGIVLAFMGQSWWLFSSWGIYARSVHLWSVQAFIALMLLHILIGFLTSGFKPPRRMVWVFGATIFCLALIQTEFGYGLRGDFSSQFRAVSGADFWNGSYLGHWLNPLSHTQAFALHVAIIPIIILGLFVLHYILEHAYGISKPYRDDIAYTMVPADHAAMYRRGGTLAVCILVLAFFFHSPYVPAATIAGTATQNPQLLAATLHQEYERTSDTAIYLDSIDPYTFDTRQVYVLGPYARLMPASTTTDPAVMIATIIPAAQSGLYEAVVRAEDSDNDTYVLRLLSDMGVPETVASTLNMDTLQWGMTKDETGSVTKLPPGSWWFVPLALLNSAFNLPANPNGDRIAAEVLGLIMLLFITFPYIPYLNRLPELLRLAPLIWRTHK